MDIRVLLLFVLFASMLSGAFMYLALHKFKHALSSINEAWAYAATAQRDARDQGIKERASILKSIESMSSWNTSLVSQCAQSAKREIEEVQRYMVAVQKDLVTAVTVAVKASSPPRINPQTMGKPILAGAGQKADDTDRMPKAT